MSAGSRRDLNVTLHCMHAWMHGCMHGGREGGREAGRERGRQGARQARPGRQPDRQAGSSAARAPQGLGRPRSCTAPAAPEAVRGNRSRHIYIYEYLFIVIYSYRYMCVYIYIYIHIHIHIHIHYIYIYIHTLYADISIYLSIYLSIFLSRRRGLDGSAPAAHPPRGSGAALRRPSPLRSPRAGRPFAAALLPGALSLSLSLSLSQCIYKQILSTTYNAM